MTSQETQALIEARRLIKTAMKSISGKIKSDEWLQLNDIQLQLKWTINGWDTTNKRVK